MDTSTERVTIVSAEAGLAIHSLRDVSDAMGVCLGHGATGLLLTESDLGPSFFDLRSGLAGELLQKFVNYGIRLAIVIPDPALHGARFAELAAEHAVHGQVRFTRRREDALAWLEA